MTEIILGLCWVVFGLIIVGYVVHGILPSAILIMAIIFIIGGGLLGISGFLGH